ncbi:MAG: hypothetical protein JWM04_2582, partial [Verrucomicrobiales bacterium]|nr:hypothetical protein [Verrucomicrobiales bacterium]
PFLNTYCIACHGKEKTEAELDLTTYSSRSAVVKDGRRWTLVLERLKDEDMPPRKAKAHPSAEVRKQAVDWFQSVRDYETKRNAGDPGIVLARRLSNSEYNYTIRDLTGVDIKPTREFPIDPANTAGFDNSGESLTMSPSLLNKYLKAAHEVADHLFLKPKGFEFAPYPMIAETDRDKYCVQQIINFYHQQSTNYTDYFEAAWEYKNRSRLGKSKATLVDMAAQRKLSAKYLNTIWETLEGAKEQVGPLARLQTLWKELPAPDKSTNGVARQGCEKMKDYVIQLRRKVEPRFPNITAGKINSGSQPLLIWKNVQYATHRMSFDPAQLQVEGEPRAPLSTEPEPGVANEFGPGGTRFITNRVGDADLVVPAGHRAAYETAFTKFCRVFPDTFYMQERGRNYFDTSKDRGRYLNAGFHSLMGYFRDDQPLYELILDSSQQKELDEMWLEMDFVASATSRMYIQFYSNGRRESRNAPEDESVQTAPSAPEETDITSQSKIKRLENTFLTQAKDGDPRGTVAIKEYFTFINDTVRRTEKARVDAEPSHLAALVEFAGRAYRRPLSKELKDDLLGYYKQCREKDGLDHESAMRESIVAILMSPDLCYRIDLLEKTTGIRPLSDYDLASRLSYFIWSSMPDQELLAHAAARDLHETKVMAAQARRMLKDGRSRALAVEFGGNWLDFRRFEEISTVDKDRFSSFTPALREAMFEEPIHLLMNTFQSNRSVLDLIYGKDTFVNPVLAKHYGMPMEGKKSNEWMHVEDATAYGRGGLLPMAAFLTKNAPGLRTSPVKRGNWVVKNVLGEKIPPPPPTVPELPKDESKLELPLREVLARHRADPSCSACHARFDALGLVFEGFGPTGERREKDLGGRLIDDSATFPDQSSGTGVAGLQNYIHNKRENDFVDNLCSKLLASALGRSLIFSDELLLQEMRKKLQANGYKFSTAIESIVTSKQFLYKRGSEEVTQR